MSTEYRDTYVRDKINTMMMTGVKSVTVYDASDRAHFVYEAGLGAEIGDPCLITEYKYIDGLAGTSRQVLAYEECVGAWPGYEVVSVGAGNDLSNLP